MKANIPTISGTGVELQKGKFEIKPNDVRLECSDIHATAQHILLYDGALPEQYHPVRRNVARQSVLAVILQIQ